MTEQPFSWSFVSFSAYTFLSVIQTPEGAEKQLSEDELVKKEMLIQLPDVSIVQKAVALGEKLLEVY